MSIDSTNALLIAGSEGGAKVYQLSSGQLISDINPTGSSLAVAYSPDGAHLAVGDSNDVAIFHTSDGALATKLRGHSALVQRLAWDPGKNTRLASSSEDRSIRIWNIAIGQTVVTITEAMRGYATDLSFSPDGQYIAAASGYENDAGIWKVDDGNLVTRIDGDSQTIAYHPTGKWLAIGGSHGVKLLHADTRKIVTQPDSEKNQRFIRTLAFDHTGKYLAASWSMSEQLGGAVQLWRVGDDGSLIFVNEVQSGTGAINNLVFSGDSKLLVASSLNGRVVAWELNTP